MLSVVSNGKDVLLICGTMNQTLQMLQIGAELEKLGHRAWFTRYYTTGIYRKLEDLGLLSFTSILGRQKAQAQATLDSRGVKQDFGGRARAYDLVVLCTDLLIPDNLPPNVPWVLVQEGLTEPVTFFSNLVVKLHRFGVPLWAANTSAAGLSGRWTRFCVASQGYADFFAERGCDRSRIVVTGIPNYDNAQQLRQLEFPLRDYVLVLTSDLREVFQIDRRMKFLREVRDRNPGEKIVFKLHPNEKRERAEREIRKLFPDAPVFQTEPAEPMIGHAKKLETQTSTLVFLGLALGIPVTSYLDLDELRRLLPLQNGGRSAANIAQVCAELL
jgi:hypothetical protein